MQGRGTTVPNAPCSLQPMASSAEVSSITPSPPHQMYFTSALDVALPSSPCTPEEGENQVNYTDVLGQRDHPLVHALDALAGLQGLALGAVGLPEVLQVGCFRGRGLQRGWGRHKEQSWSQVPPVSPSSMAEHHPGTAPGHQAQRASLRLTPSTAGPCPHLAASASGRAPRAPCLHPAAAWPLSRGTGWAS